VNYFKNKYLSNSTVATNATLDTPAIPTVTDTDTESDPTSTSEISTSDDATSTSDTTSTSETPIFDNFQNNLIDELMKTGKFTEDEAREFVSNNMVTGTDSTATSADTQTTSDTDTSTTDNTSSSDNESFDDDLSSRDTNNLEEYDNLSELVDDIKNGDIDSDENSLNDFQNSGAYKGADQGTQDCIDLAGKIGGNLIDYEIVRCSEDPNHFKNQIANNNNSNENNDT
jgi:polyhydroxyalkanoate synthesis regulator phasin